MSIKDVDSHKLMYHPENVTQWVQNGITPPLHAEIGVTNKCNNKCIFCTLDWIERGVNDIDSNIMINCLKELGELGTKSVYYAGEGEPTMHKDIAKFINYGKTLGISQAISTNGGVFNNDMAEDIIPNLSWIRFSIDAATSSTYSKIHGVAEREFNKVLSNIENAVKIKKDKKCNIDIGVQLILMPENMNEAEKLAIICKDLGVDNYQIKPAHDHPNSEYKPNLYKFSYQTLKEQIERHNTENFTVIVRSKILESNFEVRNYSECYGFQFYAIIDAKGNVVPCNVFYNNDEYRFGNLYQNNFKDIWFSDHKKTIIQKITKLNHSCCGNYKCRLDVLNRYLNRIKNPERNDEFI